MKERCFLKSQSILNLIALKNFLQLIHGTESRLVDNCKALEQEWQNATITDAKSDAVDAYSDVARLRISWQFFAKFNGSRW
jgi:hypothetical protein